ncbi:DUF5984 family protein [Actinoplanes awajinensis]|uniref:Uncharacterized protein n=1 Tax=Actinoplanes awajinensis subsp. mycoplanecinus TaxID=135947 RepID=A0A0X3V975_9ACTN|nr:DUF5984 family protein [Actinoplanes awajinensis]KUL41399.1 hypothetical protein ADL15_03880 [Actinoplanes awajinensis subsp. mycoplanecinus]
MFRIEFVLRPVLDVPAWGGDEPRLHWFGLTSAWYWMSAPGCEFLRYTDDAVRHWDLERPHPDYYVARLWEDLNGLRWALREPVPEDLIPLVDGTFVSREFPDDDFGDDVDAVFDVQGDYCLDLGYLTDSPEVSCWRHVVDGADLVTFRQQVAPAGLGTFGPAQLDATVPAVEFFAAVEDFDRRFIAAMEDRVTALERSGPPPGIDLDVRQLRAEHTNRSGWLGQRLTTPRAVDWAKVRVGAAELRTWPPLPQPDNG